MRPPHPGFHEPPAPQTPPSRRSVAFVPDVLKAIRDAHEDALDAHAIGHAVQPWATLVADSRFETEGEWRQKQAGGTRGTVELLARELRGALRG